MYTNQNTNNNNTNTNKPDSHQTKHQHQLPTTTTTVYFPKTLTHQPHRYYTPSYPNPVQSTPPTTSSTTTYFPRSPTLTSSYAVASGGDIKNSKSGGSGGSGETKYYTSSSGQLQAQRTSYQSQFNGLYTPKTQHQHQQMQQHSLASRRRDVSALNTNLFVGHGRNTANVLVGGAASNGAGLRTYKKEPKSYHDEYMSIDKRRIGNMMKSINISKNTGNVQSHIRREDDFFLNKKLKSTLQTESNFRYQVNTFGYFNEFHSLYNMHTLKNRNKSSSLGIIEDVYKAINSLNGNTCLLRQVVLENEPDKELTQRWTKVETHPYLCKFHKVFKYIDQSKENASLIFVYDFCFGAMNLSQRIMEQRTLNTVWKMIWQISSGLKQIHDNGLAYGILRTEKVLLIPSVGKEYDIKLGSPGMWCILNKKGILEKEVKDLQQKDFFDLGIIILKIILNTNDEINIDNISKWIEKVKNLMLSGKIDKNLFELTKYLVSLKNVKDHNTLSLYLKDKNKLVEKDLYDQAKFFKDQLGKNLENGRMLKLILKLNLLNYNERGFGNSKGSKLVNYFLNFLFGSGEVNLAHIYEALNKLDAGVEERILLKDKDEKYLIVTSYNEMNREFSKMYENIV